MHPDVTAAFERSGGEPLTVDITTTGRTTGAARRIEIWIVTVDGAVHIGGTPGPRDWLANVRAEPRLVLHLKDSIVADVPAVATEVTDPDRRRAIWSHRSTRWYRTQASLDELVAASPLVELTFD